MIEACADVDDAVMEKFLDGDTASITDGRDLRGACARARCSFKFVPVLCGSAFKNKGVQHAARRGGRTCCRRRSTSRRSRAIDPSKKDKIVVRKPSDEEPFAALAFKIMNDPFGDLTFFRVYSGTLESGHGGDELHARQARALRPHPAACTPTSARRSTVCYAGNIYAAVGLRDTRTGDTLCDEKQPIVLEKMEFPEPGRSPSRSSPRPRPISTSSAARCRSSPTRIRRSAPTPTRRRGRPSSPAWASSTWRSSSTASSASSRSSANVGKPAGRLPRDDHARRSSTSTASYVRQTGGHGQYGHVSIDIEPGRARRRLRVRERHRRRRHPEGVHPFDREGHPRGDGPRRARRLPGDRRQGPPPLTAASTRSTRPAPPSRSPASMAFQDGAKRPADRPARADDERRGRRPRELSWAT